MPRCDAITASFALHHIEQRRERKALYRRIGAALRPGGVLVSADCHPPAHVDLGAAGRRRGGPTSRRATAAEGRRVPAGLVRTRTSTSRSTWSSR